MSREDPQMKIRLPEKLRDRIADAAQASKRSMNAEIVARLERSFDYDMEDADISLRLNKLEAQMRAIFEKTGQDR